MLILLLAAGLPTGDPLAGYDQPWTGPLPWARVANVTAMKGDTWDARVAAALEAVKGGGVVYFPAGTYELKQSVRLPSGVILRGEPSKEPDARKEAFAPLSKLLFPRYVPRFDGDGTPNDTAFKGVDLLDPATASGCGVVDLWLERGHVRFADGSDEARTVGKSRFVVGCVLRNAAVPDPAIPDAKLKQPGWLRWTARHHAAIHVAGHGVLIANNRLPKSGEDNFTMKKFPVRAGKADVVLDEVVFDHDNRPGIYANEYGLGGSGGAGPDGTPETHPFGFRKGTVIRDNFLYHTGRCSIAFSGDGVLCKGNVIRFAKDVYRPTATGRDRTTGASTNDNRAVQMRGWRWAVEDNDYEVHRNVAADGKYRINDGEGLMHEDHVNSTVKDSRLVNNRGNTYVSIYKTAGVNGLLVENNTIADGILVVADRNKSRHECRNVRIVGNTTAGGPITLGGEPSGGNVVSGNRSEKAAKLVLRAEAEVRDNEGFTRADK